MSIEGKRYVNEVVRIVDLFTTTDALSDYEFENCLLVGPCIIYPVGSEFRGNTFDSPEPTSVVWPLPDSEWMVGAVAFEQSRFRNCRFTRIALAGDDEFRTEFLKGIKA